MVKNWDIIREILLRLESSETPNTVLTAKDVTEYPEQEVAYNMRLLCEEKLIKANICESNMGDGKILCALASCLTNKGHELLDTIRSESAWGKIQEKFKSKGVEMTFDLVIEFGKQIAKDYLFS